MFEKQDNLILSIEKEQNKINWQHQEIFEDGLCCTDVQRNDSTDDESNCINCFSQSYAFNPTTGNVREEGEKKRREGW